MFIVERGTDKVLDFNIDNEILKMMLDVFTEPETVTCVLCRATVSIRKGDKARFFNHISHDHEVHYDMELFYVVSFLSKAQKDTVINIIGKKFDKKEKSNNNKQKDAVENEKQCDDSTQKPSTEIQGTKIKSTCPKTESDETLEILILKTEEAKDPLDIEETIHEASSSKKQQDDDEKCSSCDMILPRKVMQAHYNIEHKLKLNTKICTCKICKKKVSRHSYKRHMRLVHKISNSQLEASGDQTESDEIETENKLSDTKCKLCFMTVRKRNLSRHMREHSGKLISCPLCYIHFTDERSKNSHITTVHKDEEHLLNKDRDPNFSKDDCHVSCPDCDKKFISETSMKWHCRIKHGSGNHQCESCKRKFKRRALYDKHILQCLTAPSPLLLNN